jgi:hypothetical protein
MSWFGLGTVAEIGGGAIFEPTISVTHSCLFDGAGSSAAYPRPTNPGPNDWGLPFRSPAILTAVRCSCPG